MIQQCVDSLAGKKAVVIGDTPLVGRPTAHLLRRLGVEVTQCEEDSDDVMTSTAAADVVVVDVGSPRFLYGDWVKPGAVVIDGGMNVVRDGHQSQTKKKRIIGDIDFDSVIKHARYVSPVPGGAGPLTIAMLVENTLLAWRRSVEASAFQFVFAS